MRSTQEWSGRRDSNPRPLEPHSSTLPGCATSRPETASSGETARGSVVVPPGRGKGQRRGSIPSDPRPAGLNPFEALLDRPEIQRDRREVVDLREGTRVDGQVDRLHVTLAGLARLDPDGGVRVALERRELRGILLAAGRAADPVEEPLRAAETAGEPARSAVRLRIAPPERDDRPTAAERAVAVAVEAVGRDPEPREGLDVGTEDGPREEVVGRLALAPPVEEQAGPRGFRRLARPRARQLGELGRSLLAGEDVDALRRSSRRSTSSVSRPLRGASSCRAASAAASRPWRRKRAAAKRRGSAAAANSFERSSARPARFSNGSAVLTSLPRFLEPHQLPVPLRVVDPRPRLRDRPARHRVERAGLGHAREVDVKDERDREEDEA